MPTCCSNPTARRFLYPEQRCSHFEQFSILLLPRLSDSIRLVDCVVRRFAEKVLFANTNTVPGGKLPVHEDVTVLLAFQADVVGQFVEDGPDATLALA